MSKLYAVANKIESAQIISWDRLYIEEIMSDENGVCNIKRLYVPDKNCSENVSGAEASRRLREIGKSSDDFLAYLNSRVTD